MINKERILNRFFELVKIDSETKNEAKIATYLKNELTKLNIHVREDDAKEKTDHTANNLICTLKGTKPTSETIFFSAHMDTVTPGINIKPKINGDYITSDGTTILGADNKSSIAVLFELIHVLKEQRIEHGDIQFIFTVGEESGLIGAKALDKSLVTAHYGFVLDCDGSVGNLIVSSPYKSKFNVQITGKAAHAGINPQKGVSAITTAAKAIAKMKLGKIDQATTANISYFKGGKISETNVVAEYVVIEGEARSLEKIKLDETIEQIEYYFQQTAANFGAKCKFDVQEMYPGYSINCEHKMVKIVQNAAKNINLTSDMLESH